MQNIRAMNDREYFALSPEIEEYNYLKGRMDEVLDRIERIVAVLDPNIKGFDPERMTVTIDITPTEE